MGLKLQIFWEYLIIESGVGVQVMQFPFRKYSFLATDCWLKSVWEKVDKYRVWVEVDTIMMSPPR